MTELGTRSGGVPPQRGPSAPGRAESRLGLYLLCASLAALLVLAEPLREFFDRPALATWSTVFVSIVVQALPFLVFGVLLSASITAFVPESWFRKALPARPGAAVPVAGLAGAVLPGCECASVPVAASLIRRGVPAAAALAFLLSAPAINPVVLVATAVAFPDAPEMVAGRFVASLIVAVVMGWLWLKFGKADMLEKVHRRPAQTDGSRASAFVGGIRHDLLHTGGFLVIGGITAATLNVVVPREWLDAVADNPVLAVLCLALLAVILAICSEADAFVAASLTQFSLTARLAFLVVGPTVDVKLIALQAGTFGRRFAMWFAPLTFAVAVGASVLVGWVLL
ncbi:MAG: permease [Sporichthyaceae bacterium]